jgi:O-methyltransferase domain/Dimerisation domain
MQPPDLPPPGRIMAILMGHRYARALCLATELGLADLLAEGPLPLEVIAERSGTNADALRRLLRALECIGIFSESRPNVFENSATSAYLRKDAAGSQRSLVLSHLQSGNGQFEAWTRLEYSVKTGQASLEEVYGCNFSEFARRNPEASAHLDESMRAASESMTAEATTAIDWSQFPLIADIGGGIGSLLVSILDAAPSSRGILYDQPDTIAQALCHDRMEVTSGDFFMSVPGGADAYVMRWIIHDWSDERAEAILDTVRRSCKETARLVLIEMIIPEGPHFNFGKWTDLQMLALMGGRERTAAEFQMLLAATGFQLEEIRHTQTPLKLLIAKPV